MKKTLKILTVSAVLALTVLMTLLTSFGASVSPDYVDIYSSTYNLRDVIFRASPDYEDSGSYYVNLSNLSIYAEDGTTNNREPTNLTIPPQSGDPAPTFFLSTYTSLDRDNQRLYTGVQVKNQSFSTTYFTTYTEISLHFGEMVLNPDLVSGAVNFFGLKTNVYPEPAYAYYVTLTYSGECYFPLEAGGFRLVHFAIDGSRSIANPLDGDNFRFSLAPSSQADNNSFSKLGAKLFYTRVYDALSTSDRIGLINPSTSQFFKAGDPIALRSYSVDASLSYPDHNNSRDQFTCQGFNLELPASIYGITRPDEDFLSAWNDYSRPIDFEDFDFVNWIETIVFGLGSIEILPNFYLLYPIVGAVALSLIMWALKIFLGG